MIAEAKVFDRIDPVLAASWLRNFFEVPVKHFSGLNAPINVHASVIALPYGERWRVRIAWSVDGGTEVNVSHCPTGEVTLERVYEDWREAVHDIGNAVHSGDY